MWRSGTSADAVYALFSHFCYVGGFGDLSDPVVPTLTGVSGDVVTVYASQDTEGRFLQSLALLRAVHNPCQRREMTVSNNNGLVNGPGHNLLMQFFTQDSSKIEVSETCFYDIVITQYDHPRYVKHVLGRIYVFFTRFGNQVRGGGGPKGLVHNLLMQFFTPGSSKIDVFETCFFDTVIT